MTSRSATDATRFTANSLHAYSKDTPPSSTSAASRPSAVSPSLKGPGSTATGSNVPPTPSQSKRPPETPQEKVARLRAARLVERSQKLSTWERTVIRGRLWADRLHKFTALSLIGFTIIAAGVTTFTLTDMVLHNRRKRHAFYDEQHTIYNTRLTAAIETEKAGIPLADDQVVILSRERARVAEEERRKALGVWGRTKSALLGGLKSDMGGKDDRIPVPSETEVLDKIGVPSVGIIEATEGKAKLNQKGELEGLKSLGIADQVVENRRKLEVEGGARSNEIERATKSARGGMLDQLAEEAVADAKQASKSWFGWGKGT